MKLGIPVVVAALLVLAGCGAETSADPKPSPPATSPSAPDRSPAPAAPLACEKPSKALLGRAADALAAYPGPIRAVTLVHAATTATGDWYVVALDREDAYDDGRPTGTGLRVLGLTDDLHGEGYPHHIISLGQGRMGHRPTIVWGRVSWRGSTLAAGRRAAERAVECLDEQWR